MFVLQLTQFRKRAAICARTLTYTLLWKWHENITHVINHKPSITGYESRLRRLTVFINEA